MKIAFMGTPEFASVVLEGLCKSKHQVGYVVTQPDKAKNRGKKIQFTDVKNKALENGIEVLQPTRLRNSEDIYNALASYAPDIIVVVAYGQILPTEYLRLPKYGCINVHASLLPKLRGASPIQHAIIQGEEITGVTIMQMSEGLDTGDMLTSVELPIESMNYSQLHDKLAVAGTQLLLSTLDEIESGDIKPIPQNDELSTYAKLIYKSDGLINFNNSAVSIERLIRGFDPWPGAYCQYKGNTMKLWNCRVLDKSYTCDAGTIVKVDSLGLEIACGAGGILVNEIQMPGKKRVEVKNYLLGNEIDEGTVLG